MHFSASPLLFLVRPVTEPVNGVSCEWNWRQRITQYFPKEPMRFAIYLFATVILSMPLIASSGGQTGRTSTVSSGCGGGGCHGSSANTATTLRVQQAVDGKISVTPGSQTTITVIVAHATRPAAGVNIAVKTTATSSTAAGTLALIAGEGLRISAGELTHSTPKNFTAGDPSRFTALEIALRK